MKNKDINIGDILNTILTLALILVVAWAAHQRYFADLNCMDELKDNIVEEEGDFYINYSIDTDLTYNYENNTVNYTTISEVDDNG